MDRETWSIDLILNNQAGRYVLGPLAGLELRKFVSSPPPVYIIDETVAGLHLHWIKEIQDCCCPQDEQIVLQIPGGEAVKTLAQLDRIYTWLAECRLPRDGTIVAVGGGTVLDLVGLASATWRRGVDFVSIPTSLLAMVDASIGGKTGVNVAGLKNSVGCFHPARGILADPGFLGTLPRAMWRDGLAEVIKTAAIGDPDLFNDLHRCRGTLARLIGSGPPGEPIAGILGAAPWRNWIGRCAQVKARVVSKDFRERGPRRALNLGHTLGHALEAWTMTGDRSLGHGEAIAIGMAVVFRIAAERGTCPLQDAVQMIELLEACGLPVSHAAPPPDELERLLAGDKKQSGRAGLRWVLPERIGRMDISASVSTPELLKWLADE